ncbi:hypothetical protein ACO0RG_000146 [Hanseniaspora osmophila]
MPANHHPSLEVQGFQKLNEYEKIIHVYKNCSWNCYPIMSDNKVNKNYEGKLGQKGATVIITNLRLVLQSAQTNETNHSSETSLNSLSYSPPFPSSGTSTSTSTSTLTSTSTSTSTFTKSKSKSKSKNALDLTVEYPQVIYDKKVFQKGKKISAKMLPPELVIPWIGENYLLLKFQPGKEQQPYLNYIYPWVLEIYCKTDIFALKDCFSKVILESRTPTNGTLNNNNAVSTVDNHASESANVNGNHRQDSQCTPDCINADNFVPLPKYEP